MVRASALLSLLLGALAAHGAPSSQADSEVGRRGIEQTRRASKAAAPKTYYTSLVAFGASYTDNAHPRSSAYASSLRNYYPYSNAQGRYSNGQVAVEYMVSTSLATPLKRSGVAVVLLDYAYGGSQIDNSLTYGTSPATKDQVSQYLSDLSSGNAAIGGGRVLHYINTGINPVTQIWTEAINAGSTRSAIATAKSKVSANVQAIATQMRSINTNGVVYTQAHGADYMIVGIPPLEIVPTFSYQVSGDSTKLALLKSLSNQFNYELQSFTSTFKGEAKNGKVFWFDLASLWYSFHSSPSTYGFSVNPITTTCYNSSTGSVCSNPSTFLYFDTLHPVTSAHKIIANKINAVVNAA
ncbi:hypothetical protein RQP46_010207 [Phenoliferia psychrophenolica]